ncbi:MAG: response regulator [Cyanobacteria bacterium P01_C01_bin.118]
MDNGKRERLILVVDDHCEHLQIIQQVLANSTIHCQIVTVSNSQQALDFLRHQEGKQQPARPDLILVGVPDGNGQTLLTEVKTDASLRRIPTIILSASDDPSSVITSYQLQCNSYVVKPHDLIHLNQVIQVIESFWLNIVTLPME